MAEIIFVAVMALLCAALIAWGARVLPGEHWQVFAAVPVDKDGQGRWRGRNITYYGVLSANAYALAAALMVIMMGSVGAPPLATLAFAVPLLSVCVPASRLVARWVENKPATLTVGGAVFVGFLLAPWLAVLASRALGPEVGAKLQPLPALAALAVAYAFGEGLGRLACLSFGCCYGKALCDCTPGVAKLFDRWALVFSGDTKKIAYESGLAGQKVIPVQVISASVNTAAGLIGLYIFLAGWFYASLLAAIIITQGWRFVSEMLRADYRGGQKISAYQWMALFGIAYCALAPLVFSQPAITPRVALGLAAVWSPGVLLFLQVLWLAMLLYTGRSKTTASTMSFHVVRDNI